jgi:sigma-E factor negative regulatory protein RseA
MNAGNVVERGGAMTDPVPEQLSACLDGELPAVELDLLLKRTARDAQLREIIARYALISAAVRAETPAIASRGFAAKVMAAVEQEQAPTAASTASRTALRYLRPAAGLAVAAGVAAIAVFAVQQMEGVPAQQAPATIAGAEDPSATGPSIVAAPDDLSYVVPTSTSAALFVPATRLTNYVVAHSEYSSPLGRRSVLSSVLAEDDTESSATQGSTADSDAEDSSERQSSGQPSTQGAVQER